MLALLAALAVAQFPHHRQVMQPNLPSAAPPPYQYATFEVAPPTGVGMTGECGQTNPTSAQGDALTMVRATVSECYSQDGQTVTQVPANIAVQMTGQNDNSTLGIYTQDTVTNGLLWSRDLSNAAWTKTNMTCARTANGMRGGDANGASTCTATSAAATVLQTFVRGSTPGSSSLHIKRRTGSGTVSVTRDGATYADITSSLSTTVWKRVVGKETSGCYGATTSNCIVVAGMSTTSANPTVGFKLATSGDAVDVDFLQDENNSVVGLPIETTTVAVTRNIDDPRFTVTAPTASTYCFGANVSTGKLGGSLWLAWLQSNAGVTVYHAGYNSTNTRCETSSPTKTATITAQGLFFNKRLVCANDGTNNTGTFDGTALTPIAATVNLNAATVLRIGENSTGAYDLYGVIKRIRYEPNRATGCE